MEDKRENLKSTKQKNIITAVVQTLSASHPSFYYLSTSEIASEVKNFIDQPGNLQQAELNIVKALDHRDIQMLLSLH